MMKKTKVIPVKNEYEQLMSVQSVQPMMTETNETSFVSLHSEVATKQVEVKNADEQDDKNFSDKEQELIRMYKQQTKLLSMKESIASSPMLPRRMQQRSEDARESPGSRPMP